MSAVSKKMPMVKNVVLVGLVLVCIGLTFRLWFGGVGAMPSVFGRTAAAMPADAHGLTEIMLRPMRIIAPDGSGRYIVDYAGVAEHDLHVLGGRILGALLRGGSYDGSRNIDIPALAHLLLNSQFAFDYNFPIPADIFSNFFEQSSNLLTNRLNTFDLINFSKNENNLIINFTDTDNMRTSAFFINYAELAEDTAEILAEFLQKPAARHFLDTTRRIAFIPEFAHAPPIYRLPPYPDMQIDTIRDFVQFFFPNPGGIVPSHINQIFTYRDNDRTVDFLPNSVMVYSTSNRAADSGSTMASSLIAALHMISRDFENMAALSAPVNEIFLSNFNHDPALNEWRFYFDYIVDNRPLRFSPQFAEHIMMEHAIIVRVRGDRVIHYRRLLAYFGIDERGVLFEY